MADCFERQKNRTDHSVWSVSYTHLDVYKRQTVNGVNFTDGLDGLASSVTILVATFFSVVAYATGAGIAPVTCAVVGALLGFLLFNVYPASVFMGDTGSLALGGFVAATAYMMQMPIFILIVGLIYWIEILSVMIQDVYKRQLFCNILNPVLHSLKCAQCLTDMIQGNTII